MFKYGHVQLWVAGYPKSSFYFFPLCSGEPKQGCWKAALCLVLRACSWWWYRHFKSNPGLHCALVLWAFSLVPRWQCFASHVADNQGLFGYTEVSRAQRLCPWGQPASTCAFCSGLLLQLRSDLASDHKRRKCKGWGLCHQCYLPLEVRTWSWAYPIEPSMVP